MSRGDTHSLGKRRWSIDLFVGSWGVRWQIGGFEEHRDLEILGRLVFYRAHEPYHGWSLALTPITGSLMGERWTRGKWEAWVFRGPLEKIS